MNLYHNRTRIPIGTDMTHCLTDLSALDTIPGMDRRGAERRGAETGIDMARFGTAARLATWAGVAPGNDESAGKQRSGLARLGNHPLRTVLMPMAHAAAHTRRARGEFEPSTRVHGAGVR